MDGQSFLDIPVYFRFLFLHFPFWAVFLIVVGFFVLLSLLLYWILPYFVKPRREPDQVRIASILVGVVGAFYAMLFGLVNVNLWQGYHKMQDIISQEASNLSIILLNSEVFAEPTRTEIRDTIKKYVNEVRTAEWQKMAYRQSDPVAWQTVYQLFSIIQAYQPKAPHEQSFYNATLTQLNNLILARRARIDTLQNSIPAPLFRVLVLGSILLVFLLNLTIIKVGTARYLLFMSIIVNILIAFNFYLVLDLDNVFSGRAAVQVTPFYEGSLAKLSNGKI